MKKNKFAGSPMDAALDYISDRARTVREVEDKLDSLNFGEYEVNQVIDRLMELKYLDDEKYAADFIATRLATKPISRKKLWMQLYAHKLSKDVINAALEAVTPETEQENALTVAKKFNAQFAALEEHERKQRVARRLMGRGFGYDTAKCALETIFDSADDVDFSCADDEDGE